MRIAERSDRVESLLVSAIPENVGACVQNEDLTLLGNSDAFPNRDDDGTDGRHKE